MPKIIVKSAVDGFRRAGYAFTREGVTLDTKDLTKDQLKALRDEPRLSVSEVSETAAEKKAREEAEKVAADKAKAEGDGKK